MSPAKIKELTKQYPYLIPRNVWTDKIVEDYDYVVGEHDLPEGWFNLFLMMCEDIRQPLIDADYLDKFRFSDVKEKYNNMRCYNFGAPKKVQKIIDKYEYMSQFICTKCGKIATKETAGYILSYCDECFDTLKFQPTTFPIEPKFHYYITTYDSTGRHRRKISFKREWNKYIKKFGGNYETN